MLKVNTELTQCPNMTYVKGEFNNKSFGMNYYLDGSYKISGNFTETEKKNLVSNFLDGLY